MNYLAYQISPLTPRYLRNVIKQNYKTFWFKHINKQKTWLKKSSRIFFFNSQSFDLIYRPKLLLLQSKTCPPEKSYLSTKTLLRLFYRFSSYQIAFCNTFKEMTPLVLKFKRCSVLKKSYRYRFPYYLMNNETTPRISETLSEVIARRQPLLTLFKYITKWIYKQQLGSHLLSSLHRRAVCKQRYSFYQRIFNSKIRFGWAKLNLQFIKLRRRRRWEIVRKYVYGRLIKKTWLITRQYQYKRLFTYIALRLPSFKITGIRQFLSRRLDSVLVSKFHLKSLRYAKILILLGHIFINGVRAQDHRQILSRFDYISFSFESLRWLKLLRFRTIKRLLKHRRTGRRFFSGILFSPGGRSGVLWNYKRLNARYSKFHSVWNKKLFIPSHQQAHALLQTF